MWGPKQEKVPKPVWLLVVYCNKLLQRLPQVKAAVTSPLAPSSDWTPPMVVVFLMYLTFSFTIFSLCTTAVNP